MAASVYYYFPSTKSMTRALWRQLHSWLRNKIISAHIAFLSEFGGIVLLLPEMAWSEQGRFRASECPARWAYRLDRLTTAQENITLFS